MIKMTYLYTCIIQNLEVVLSNGLILCISLWGLQLLGIAKQGANPVLYTVSCICL